ncbi:MAG: hypothetical protein K0U78_20605 [Actinomycetia bacterium]|nr:hypothetical protein [Actinomycetes bacterium]
MRRDAAKPPPLPPNDLAIPWADDAATRPHGGAAGRRLPARGRVRAGPGVPVAAIGPQRLEDVKVTAQGRVRAGSLARGLTTDLG